jgi:hypothetical protein
VIAGLDGCHLGANRLNDAGAFMAEYDWPIERKPPNAVDDVEVAVANAGGHGAHQHLAAPRLVNLHRFD